MPVYGSFRSGILLLIVSLLGGPALAGAADSPRSGKDGPRRATVSGAHGDARVASTDATKNPEALRFHDAVDAGDQVTTGSDGIVEVLVGRHALVTLHEDSTLKFFEDASGRPAVQLATGEARLAVARTEETLTIQTPTATAVTRGGLIRVKVTPSKRHTSHAWSEGAQRPMPIALTGTGPIAAAQAGPMETFQVSEGAIQVKASAPGSALTTVEAGQTVQVTAGQVGKPSAAPPAPAERYSLPAADVHSRTSDAGLRHLVGQQKQQAEALQRVLLGPSDTERPLTKSAAVNAIVSTSGVIISTTGQTLTESQGQTNSASLFAAGGLFSAGSLTSRQASGTGVAEDTTIPDILPLHGTLSGKSFSVRGGGGLLVFDRHTIQAQSELVLVDSGDPRQAPHNGAAPTAPLLVTPSPLLPPPSGNAPRPHTGLPLQFANALVTGGGTAVENFNRNAEVFIVTGGNPITDLQQYSRENKSIPGGLSGTNTQPDNVLVARTTVDGSGNFGSFANPRIVGLAANQRETSLVDAVVRARSDIAGNGTVALSGGVVLNNTTRLIAAFSQNAAPNPALPPALQPPGSATRQYFTQTGQSEVINGSIVAVVAKESNQTLRPAFASLADRVLAVLDGSTLGPDSGGTRIGLLSVLDSQLIGPAAIPSERRAQSGTPGIPPLLEIINSNPPLSNPGAPGVQATSAVVVRSTGALNGILAVDRGLVEASSPLVAMVNSTMATTGHFADLGGAGTAGGPRVFTANLVPGDALVRLDASRLTVMGNLFNFTNGAHASVTGHLFSLTNGSSLTVNGALVSLTGNSVLNLTSTAFGAFGGGANSLLINNALCAGGCAAIVGFPGLRVSGGGTVALPEGFIPFTLQPGAAAPRVTIGPNAAAFHVEPQSQLNVTLRQ